MSNTAEENLKMSTGFFSLQGNPVLLLPWLVFTVVYLIANTVLYIVNAAQYFDAGYGSLGAGYIVGAIIYIRK